MSLRNKISFPVKKATTAIDVSRFDEIFEVVRNGAVAIHDPFHMCNGFTVDLGCSFDERAVFVNGEDGGLQNELVTGAHRFNKAGLINPHQDGHEAKPGGDCNGPSPRLGQGLDNEGFWHERVTVIVFNKKFFRNGDVFYGNTTFSRIKLDHFVEQMKSHR